MLFKYEGTTPRTIGNITVRKGDTIEIEDKNFKHPEFKKVKEGKNNGSDNE